MKWVTVVACIGLLFGVKAYNDRRCTAKGGKCQYISNRCRNGQYQKKLCGGPYNRRCCVPDGQGSCSQRQKELACSLVSNGNVRAAKWHPSGERDNAYAYNNLRDVCNGKQASRSSYYCKGKNCYAPGKSTCLSVNLLTYLNDLARKGTVIINEIAGACHSCRSRHYSGLAVDLHRADRGEEYMVRCVEHQGWALNETTHVHCQFDDGPHPNW